MHRYVSAFGLFLYYIFLEIELSRDEHCENFWCIFLSWFPESLSLFILPLALYECAFFTVLMPTVRFIVSIFANMMGQKWDFFFSFLKSYIIICIFSVDSLLMSLVNLFGGVVSAFLFLLTWCAFLLIKNNNQWHVGKCLTISNQFFSGW